MKLKAGILFLLIFLFGVGEMACAQIGNQSNAVLRSEADIPTVLREIRNQYGNDEADTLLRFISMAQRRSLFDKFLVMKSASELVSIQKEAHHALEAYQKIYNALYIEIQNHKFFMRDLRHNGMFEIRAALGISIHNTSMDTVKDVRFMVTFFDTTKKRLERKKINVRQTIMPDDAFDSTYYADLIYLNSGFSMRADPVGFTLKNGDRYELTPTPYLAVYGIALR